MTSEKYRLEAVRCELLKVLPTGPDGFEGLMQAVLTEVTGVPFRLSAAGSQRGRDGAAAYPQDGISFECKRYRGKIQRASVLSKLTEFSREPDAELWILCATVPVAEQLARDVREVGRQVGVSTYVLDWSGELPPLAVALSLARGVLSDSLPDESIAALEALGNVGHFKGHAARLRDALSEPTVGVAAAATANQSWLMERFSNARLAKRAFGARLAPFDPSLINPYPRVEFVNRVRAFLTADLLEENVLWITGDEGAGKSWLVPLAWKELDRKPLIVVLGPEEFAEDRPAEDLLVAALVAQTGDPDRVRAGERWRRKFDRWRRGPATSVPRFVVVVDGLNQRPDIVWVRRLEQMEEELDSLSGRLIAIVRSAYFRDRIRPGLGYDPVELSVPEWSESERNAILAQYGVVVPDDGADGRHVLILSALQNPRLLGIAVELLGNRQVESLDELGVSRLLLEHMRLGERDAFGRYTFDEYEQRLRKRAEEVVQRLAAGTVDDLALFEDVESIAGGRFFVTVRDAPGRYTLGDSVLPLALGFCVVDRLRFAHRNRCDPWAALDEVIDPIASLDQTANIVEAALAISVTAEDAGAVVPPLVAAFAGLQNPPRSLVPAFRRWARAWPKAFLDAAKRLLLEGGHHPNVDWIEDALCAARADQDGWSAISAAVSDWLGCYSRPVGESGSEAQVTGDGKVWFDWARISAREESLLGGMTEVSGRVEALSRFGLRLIAGGGLTPFAKGLVQTVFANTLEQDALSVGRDVEQLVGLNRVDWRETREALRREQSVLQGDDTSRAGRWALVRLLRATGDPEDASSADRLVRQLSDWDGGEAWRLVEQYCASDPCDPSSSKPENVAEAVKYYDKLDMGRLRPDMGQTQEDHLFGMLRPAMARFEPARAAERHRDFGRQVSAREGHALRFGLFGLEPHNSILGRELALKLLTASRQNGSCGRTGEGQDDDDRWIVSEYGRLLTFPYLSAQEQLQLLPDFDDKRGPLLRLVGLAKPVNQAELERCFEEACKAKRGGAICALLAFCRQQRVTVSERLREGLSSLMESPEEIVRSTALGVVEYIDDTKLVSRFAASDWTSADLKGTFHSDFFGSLVVIRAAEEGLIPWQEALTRVSARTYGVAVDLGGSQVAGMVAELIHESIRSALQLDVEAGSRWVEVDVPSQDRGTPNLARVCERPIQEVSVGTYFGVPEDSAKRRARDREFFDAFTRRLRKWRAEIVMYPPSLQAFEEIVRSSEHAADQWVDWFRAASDQQVSLLRGVALSLAHAVRESSPDKTAALLRRVKDIHSMVRHTCSPTGVGLDAFVSWSAADTEDVVRLCFERLDDAGNDHEIAFEVLAALAADRDVLLSRFVDERWNSSEPEGMARALMVLGFSRPQVRRQWDLDAMQRDHGLVGEAWKAAKYAWDRDQWARHWFGEMCAARRPLEFWRYSVLFRKIVDARFKLWRPDYDTSSELMRSFEPSIGQEIDSRVKRWRSHREKKLFGGSVPAEVFRPEPRRQG